MYTVTVARPDLATDAVVQALHDGLGPSYNVLPGMRQTRSPFSEPVPGSPDTIVVGIGSNRVQRAQVRIVRSAASTKIDISPGGLLGDRVLNMLGIARQVHRVLAGAPGLQSPSAEESDLS